MALAPSRSRPGGGTVDTGGAHTDTAALDGVAGNSAHAMNRIRIRSTCYIDDCPPGAGGLHVWPGSHKAIWSWWQQCLDRGLEFNPHRNPAARLFKRGGGEAWPPPVECFGTAGTVVLWHETMLHNQGVNCSRDVIRLAVHTDFHKTVASVPDGMLRGSDRRIWRDWSRDFLEASGPRL